MEPAVTTLQSLQYTSTGDQLAFTEAMAREAAVVTRAILDLDLQAISVQIAKAIVGALR
jgi:hypothetical protein